MVSTISEELSNKIKGISFLSALLVVLLHASLYGLDAHCNVVSWHVIRFLSYGVTRVAVPLFFFISGFLFTHQYDNGIRSTDLLKRRFISLGKPYIYWSLIYVFTLMLFTIWGNHMTGRPLNNNTCLELPLTSWKNPFRIFGVDVFIVPACGPLWYVRNLFFLFPLFPLLQKFFVKRHVGAVFLAVMAFCYFAHSFKYEPEPWWKIIETGFAIRGLLFFAAGIYLKRFPVHFEMPCHMAVTLCMVWFLLAWPWHFSFIVNVALDSVSVLIGSVAFWKIYDFLPGIKKLASWRAVHYSFFIYVSHWVIMSILFCRKVCDFIKTRICDSDLLIYGLRFVVAVGVAIAAAYLLERFMPKLYKALTGGR